MNSFPTFNQAFVNPVVFVDLNVLLASASQSFETPPVLTESTRVTRPFSEDDADAAFQSKSMRYAYTMATVA